MTSMTIEGARSKQKMEVDSNGFAETKSFTQTFELRHSVLGYAFNLNTGTINMDSTANGVSYLKNTGVNPLVITAYIYLLGNSTDGTGDGFVTVIENPTGGTLISGGTTGTVKNRNVNSKRTLSATWKIGNGSQTVTGGTTLLDTLLASPAGRHSVPVFTVLENGGSIAIKYTPQSNNSSQNCQFAFAVYEDFLGKD